MDPNQLPPQQNPYSFITSTGPAPKKPLLGGGSMKSRILLVGGTLLLIIIIFTVVSSLLSGGSKGTISGLKDIIAKQQEIIRIAELGAKDATSVDARNFAKTVSLTVQTDQTKTVEILSSNNGKIIKEEQAASFSSKTDQALEAAKANNQYDTVLKETLTTQLTAYLATLKKTHDGTNGKNTKENLSSSYKNASTLIAPPQAGE